MPPAQSSPQVEIPSAPAAPPSPARPPVASIARPTTIGDVSCSKDTDCVVTAKGDRCDLGLAEPVATGRAWLAWRDQTGCPGQRCAPPHAAGAGASVEPEAAFRARCDRAMCRLVRAAP